METITRARMLVATSRYSRDLRIGRLRSNRIRIESGVTIRIRYFCESNRPYMTFYELGLLKVGVHFGFQNVRLLN